MNPMVGFPLGGIHPSVGARVNIPDEIKTVLAWIGLLALIPSSIVAVRDAGLVRTAGVLGLFLAVLIVIRWHRILNFIRNTETTYRLNVINSRGDCHYEKHSSFLPYFWPVRSTEVFISISGDEAKIEAVDSNCEIEWKKRLPNFWHGHARPPKHRPYIFAMGNPAGFRVSLTSRWSKAYKQPPYDFVVACGSRASSRIFIDLEFAPEIHISRIEFQEAPLPTPFIGRKQMVDTNRLPWHTIDCRDLPESVNQPTKTRFEIKAPKRFVAYRLSWAL